MNIKEANKIVCEYIEDNSCMCLVNSICPSPSSHHEFCINKDCNKKITHTSYHPYAKSNDSLIKVWNELFRGYSQIRINSIISEEGLVVSFIDSDGETVLTEEGSNISETYCIATAKYIQKLKEEH